MGFEGPPARPPLPPKTEKPPEPVVQPETPVVEAPQEVAQPSIQETPQSETVETPAATAPQEGAKAEDDPKEKAFGELQSRFNQDTEKKAADPENPVNKISAIFSKDASAKRSFSEGFDSTATRRTGIEQAQLDEVLPDLLAKGVISEKELSRYILNSTLEGRSGVNMARFSKLAETIPAKAMANMVNADGILGETFDKWYNTTRSEIDKELTVKRPINDGRIMLDNPDKIIKAISQAGRFTNEGELDVAMKDAMDSYKILPRSMKFRQEAGGEYKYPVLENLFDAGYSTQAEEILEGGLSKKEISPQIVVGYQKKGYITEERAKAMLDRAGLLG